MGKVLAERQASDGWDVTVRLDDGRTHTFHSASGKPADLASWVKACEAQLLAAEAEESNLVPEIIVRGADGLEQRLDLTGKTTTEINHWMASALAVVERAR